MGEHRLLAFLLAPFVALVLIVAGSTAAVAQGRIVTHARTRAIAGAGVPLEWQSTYSGSETFNYTATETGGKASDDSSYHWSDTVENVVHPDGGSFTEKLYQQTVASGTHSTVRSGAFGAINLTCSITSSPSSATAVSERTGGSTLVPELGDKLPIQVDWGVPVPSPDGVKGLPNEGSIWSGLVTSPPGNSEGPGAVNNGPVSVSPFPRCSDAPSSFLGYTASGCAACIFGSVAGYTSLQSLTEPTPTFLDAWGGIGTPYGQQNITLGQVINKPVEKSFTVRWGKSTSGAGGAETGQLNFNSHLSFAVCNDERPTVVLYSARGSSEAKSAADPNGLGTPALALYKLLRQRAAAAKTDLLAEGDPYPALDIEEGFKLDAQHFAAPTSHYKASVAEGVKDGVDGLEHIASQRDASGKCWYLVLSGYSQGAEVMRRVIAELPTDVLAHVVAVELFGDPYFSATEANVTASGTHSPDAIGVRLFDWRYLHNGPPPPALPVATFSWCNEHDLVCGFNNSLDRWLLGTSTLAPEEAGHFHYQDDACEAANQVSGALRDVGQEFRVPPC